MDFETYLRNKNIDPLTFQKAEPVLWQEFKLLFDQVHPDSFTAQKLFLINGIRRKYQLQEEARDAGNIAVKGKAEIKPVPQKPKPSLPTAGTGNPKPKIVAKVRMVPKIKKKED